MTNRTPQKQDYEDHVNFQAMEYQNSQNLLDLQFKGI